MPSINLGKLKVKKGSDWCSVCPWRVGDLLFSTTSTNPAAEWPGTSWSLYARDRFPVSAGLSYPLGATGGFASVTLSADALPQISLQSKQRDDSGGTSAWGLSSEYGNVKWDNTYIRLPGGNKSHENRPPYIAVNIWRRVS